MPAAGAYNRAMPPGGSSVVLKALSKEAREGRLTDGDLLEMHQLMVLSRTLDGVQGGTFDHRVVDGADAAAFLQDVKRRLEAFGLESAID